MKNICFEMDELKKFIKYSNKFQDGSSVEEHYELWLKWKKLIGSGLDEPLKNFDDE